MAIKFKPGDPKCKAIEACMDPDGNIDPEELVKQAKNPKNALHGEFEWDNPDAAHKYRIIQAKELIRVYTIEVYHETVQLQVPVYISNPDAKGKYTETVKVADKPDMAERALRIELERIKGAIRRALSLSVAFHLVKDFETMMDTAIKIEKTSAGL